MFALSYIKFKGVHIYHVYHLLNEVFVLVPTSPTLMSFVFLVSWETGKRKSRSNPSMSKHMDTPRPGIVKPTPPGQPSPSKGPRDQKNRVIIAVNVPEPAYLQASKKAPRHGSVLIQKKLDNLKKAAKEAETEKSTLLQSSTGKAKALLNNTKDSLATLEHEVWKLEHMREVKAIERKKLSEELAEIERQIANLEPRYNECCEEIAMKQRMQKLLQTALKNAKSKTGGIMDVQRVEHMHGQLKQKEALRRHALRSIGKDPPAEPKKFATPVIPKNKRCNKEKAFSGSESVQMKVPVLNHVPML